MKTALLTVCYLLIDSINSEYLKEDPGALICLYILFAIWDYGDHWSNYRNNKK